MIILHQIKCDIHITEDKLKKKCADMLKISINDIAHFSVLRESLDARKKPDIFKVYEVGIALKNKSEKDICNRNKKLNIEVSDIKKYEFPFKNINSESERPIIIGFGPAGIFCAYLLAVNGFKPLVLERGKSVDKRIQDVNSFWETGKLNTESNVLFGEGGAGTFSDGKLNTLVKGSKDIQRFVMETFCEFGADRDICYSYKPHIGTDVLAEVIPRMRKKIEECGGQVLFEHKATRLIINNNRISGVEAECNGKKLIFNSTNICLAIGHSARDTFRLLFEQGVNMQPKPFAVGVRCEHDQKLINTAQYGPDYDDVVLGAAPYKVVAKTEDDRGVYSFCMCPGGYVVNSSSENGRLCVNGMSYRDRNSGKANSAIVVAVNTDDFPGDSPLKGVLWQEKLEETAYKAYEGKIPVQRLVDFKNNRRSEEYLTPMIKGLWTNGDLNTILPDFISNGIKTGFEQFGRKIKGFDNDDTLLIGLESRTSSPVRINRDEAFQSNITGLYPCGEGAGYAGGITSAAVDGCKIAERIAKNILMIEA